MRVVMNQSLIFADPGFIARTTRRILERRGDNPFVACRAHRLFLWAGDIETAKEQLLTVAPSKLPEDTRLHAELRQACAENELVRAEPIYAQPSRIEGAIWPCIQFLSQKIMGEHRKAIDAPMPIHDAGQIDVLSDFPTYAHFDARLYPRLVALLAAMAVESRGTAVAS